MDHGRISSSSSLYAQAASIDADTYKAAHEAINNAQAAKKTLADATAALRATLNANRDADPDLAIAMLQRAQRTWAAARLEVRTSGALRTYLDGKRERKACRALGLLDERSLRHDQRMAAVEHELLCPTSHLSKITAEMFESIAEFAAF